MCVLLLHARSGGEAGTFSARPQEFTGNLTSSHISRWTQWIPRADTKASWTQRRPSRARKPRGPPSGPCTSTGLSTSIPWRSDSSSASKRAAPSWCSTPACKSLRTWQQRL